jgi:four helix bundle protein
MENNETRVWLEYALACNYITSPQYEELLSDQQEIGKLIGTMIYKPEKFLPTHLKKAQ